jgi:AmmeMemoRadiSam system protein A
MPTLDAEAGLILLPIARSAIATKLGKTHPAREEAAWLQERGACFVTLTQNLKLRGCIGTLRAHRALVDDVKANAVAAAFRDPRFKPLSDVEFEAIEVEISLLSALEAMSFADEQDALAQLRAGVDGLVFEYGRHSSTFLPQVWESLSEPAEFMAHLKHKAGLPPDFWDHEVKLSRYTVSKWRETDLRAALR